ncbi:MAG: selenocysteine-specific translation elongation factor [Acidobacteria bacterium]|nr:selenocysteine-specific translation elongation factor [Acidobacteriota bacterium]
MRHIVIGTAGHIDHGKTVLVKALTGIDCDRLPEEKKRGITIDLGFAHMEEGDLQVHFVDVPGHERLVHTMIAGASGIDMALLVVAADEGVMPQTREHLEVIRLMGVPGGAVALTKADLVDEETLEIATDEIRSLLRTTPFAGAPIVAVSARTGRGIPELRRVLVEQASGARPHLTTDRPYREAVDRVFTMAGAGTVITGTSLWGTLRAGDPVVILPAGRESRARRLHVHGAQRREVEAGERVAINLAGLGTTDVHRGDQVMTPGPWQPTRLVTVRLELLGTAPRALDEDEDVELHALAARVAARVQRLSGRPLKPGQTAVAQIALERPLVCFPGDRFVLRRPAPVNTFAGGMILDAHLPRFHRRDAGQLRDLPSVQRSAWPALLESWIVRSGLAAVPVTRLAGRLGILETSIEAPLGRLVETGRIRTLPTKPVRLVAESHIARLAERARETLGSRLAGQEVSAGIPARDFAASILPRGALPLADAYLEELRTRGALDIAEGMVVPVGRREHMTPMGEELTRKVEKLYRDAGLTPPSPKEVAATLAARPATIDGICAFLVRRGRLARLEGKLLIHSEVLEEVRRSVLGWGVDSFEIGQFKERFGLTRRLAIPILGWLDAERVTLRQGSRRKVIRRRG